jgi:MFS family permease
MSVAAGSFLFEWIWGALSDRIGRSVLITISMFAMAILFPLYTVRNLVPYFVILQFMSGAFAVTVSPITRALVSDRARTGSVGLSISLLSATAALGRAAGPLVGTYAAQVWSFEKAFYLSFLLAIIGATVSIRLRNKELSPTATSTADPSTVGGLKALLSVSSICKLFALATLTFVGLSVLNDFLPLYASERIGMTTVEIGIMLTAVAAAQIVVTPMLGWFSDKVGRKVLISVCFASSSTFFICYMVAQTWLQLVLISVGLATLFSAGSMLLATLSDMAPRRLRGMAMGLYGTFEDLGMMLGPLLYGIIWNTYGSVYIFVASSAAQILGILIFQLIREEHSHV